MGKLTKNLVLFALGVLLSAVCVSCGTSSRDLGMRNEAGVAFEDKELLPALTQSFEWISYSVQQGDTIIEIAGQFRVGADVVIVCNDIRNVRDLQAGNILRIPNMDGLIHTVKAKDTIAGISIAYHVSEEVIRNANDISGYTLKEGQRLFIPGANKK